MFALLKKEINTFFASPIGYLVMAVFLLINSLFLWFFKGEHNILDYGFSDLSPFFLLAPWIFLFLIPAITMRSFSDEKRQGTLELLLTKPLSELQLVLGKFLAALCLTSLALIPTLLYVYTIYQLGNPIGNIDMGSTLGSYFGLFLLTIVYTAIGLFASTLSKNQIVAFIIAMLICFLFFIGIQGIADYMHSTTIEKLGISYHFKSISRGVLDTRDIVYFLSISVFFIVLTILNISTKKKPKSILLQPLQLSIALLLVYGFAQAFYARFDLTKDKRYTLSDASHTIIKNIQKPIVIDVFLEGEGFPSNIRRLQAETQQLLEEFANKNKAIKYRFINPIENPAHANRALEEFSRLGMTPMMLTVQDNGKSSQEAIIPWAMATYGKQRVIISLIKNQLGARQEALIQNSVQHLEYAFTDGFSKLVNTKQKKIAVLKGNGQMQDKYMASFLNTLSDYYIIDAFSLDSVSSTPKRVLKQLQEFSLILAAKPTEAFSESEKLVLDQYIMNGGKSLWLIDKVAIEKDSLYNDTGSNVSISRHLNLTDFFFKYGARINPVLVKDLYSKKITLATGQGSNTQFVDLNWPYSPLASGNPNHPISNNLNLVNLDFANQIDTLKTSTSRITKTVLLKSSPLSKIEGSSKIITLEEATQKQDPKTYTKGNQTLGILLEGEFTSVYHNRVKPFKLQNEKIKSKPTKMIVIADGDIIKNEINAKNQALQLGFDRRNGKLYGNSEFLLNAINYLLDDNGLINIRSKEVAIAYLNLERVAKEKIKWQSINILLPLVLLAGFGVLFNYYRRKKYAK